MLLIAVISTYSETYKADFFRRYAHCAALLSKLGEENASRGQGDFSIDCWRYLCTGNPAKILPSMQRRLGLHSIPDVEVLFESAGRYITTEEDILDESHESRDIILNGMGYSLVNLFYNADRNSRGTQPYLGAKNNLLSWMRFGDEVVGNPVFAGYEKTRPDYIRFLRNHCKTFTASMPDPDSSDPMETRIPIRFSIDEILEFPIPVF